MSGRSHQIPAVAAQRGLALIAVLWIVAALSIAVTGLTQVVRGEIRGASDVRDTAIADATGEAAIAQVLQELSARREPIRRWVAREVPVNGQTVGVQAMPLEGLIDLNGAPPALLAALFQHGAGVPGGAAGQLAAAVVQVRQQRDASGRPLAFEAVEDLLRVPGMDYAIYAAVRPLISVDQQAGGGRVNPLAAPDEVLQVIADGDPARVARLRATRDGDGNSLELSTINPEYISASGSRRLRFQARVDLADARWVLVTRVVDLTPDLRTGLPWQVMSAERLLRSDRS